MLERLGSVEAIKEFVADFAYPIVVTRGPIVVAVNDAWISIIGFPREQVEGQPYFHFMPPEERQRLIQRETLRMKQPDKIPFSQMTSLALKADGRSTIVHVQPTVLPAAEGERYVINFLFVVPERDAEIELAELLVATSTSLAKARTDVEVRQFAVRQLGEGGYETAFFRRDGSAIYPPDATLPAHVASDLEEAVHEERALFVGPELEIPAAVIIPIHRGTDLELLSVAGPRLVTPLRPALRLFAQGVGSALDTAILIADLERRNRELSETRAELVRHERLAALGEMAASVAHEVRNPVGVVSNAVSTLRRRLDGDTQNSELLSIIDEECIRLERMVRDLLEFARPRTVTFTLEPLTEIAEEAISVVSSQPDPMLRRTRFEIEHDAGTPKVKADRDLLRQALVNLLLNAAQASKEHDIVRVRIAVENDSERQSPSISIVDSGCGIADPIVDRIFDPFFTTRAQGSGLGLAVVKRIVDAIRAEIHVDATPGGGATFRLTFRG
jgi:PAS domain S-box-containing protein